MPRRILQGTVVSDKADKTIVVQVVRRYKHPLLNKILRRSKKFMAHDADNRAKTGDAVRIRECRPLSKHKRWELLSDVGDKTNDTANAALELLNDASDDQSDDQSNDTAKE